MQGVDCKFDVFISKSLDLAHDELQRQAQHPARGERKEMSE